jgi:hypothetical protein
MESPRWLAQATLRAWKVVATFFTVQYFVETPLSQNQLQHKGFYL